MGAEGAPLNAALLDSDGYKLVRHAVSSGRFAVQSAVAQRSVAARSLATAPREA
jgi:hypothetical protein